MFRSVVVSTPPCVTELCSISILRSIDGWRTQNRRRFSLCTEYENLYSCLRSAQQSETSSNGSSVQVVKPAVVSSCKRQNSTHKHLYSGGDPLWCHPLVCDFSKPWVCAFYPAPSCWKPEVTIFGEAGGGACLRDQHMWPALHDCCSSLWVFDFFLLPVC